MIFQYYSERFCFYHEIDCTSISIPLLLFRQLFCPSLIYLMFSYNLLIPFIQASAFVNLCLVFEKYPLVNNIVTPAKKEVHTAKGIPILVLPPVKNSEVTVVTPVTPSPVSEIVG